MIFRLGRAAFPLLRPDSDRQKKKKQTAVLRCGRVIIKIAFHRRQENKE